MATSDPHPGAIPAFDRSFFDSESTFTRIGGGSLGGKAQGLIQIQGTLAELAGTEAFRNVDLVIPRLTVVGTEIFDQFLEMNDLLPVALSESSDQRIAHAFQKGDLPSAFLGDLRGLVEHVHSPLAVRSSSLLEDALKRPFAGVYETKMIPNNQPGPEIRFQRLAEAVKLIFASTFFRDAKNYREATGDGTETEKMGVIVQEVLGGRHGHRFYPHLSLVARSYNYYPTGKARPDEGVVNLALGLGKTIVDGGACWSYSPAHPAAPPPFGSSRQILQETQSRFWAVNMGPPPAYDPIAETEYLLEGDLADAEYDDTLKFLVSTYDGSGDRFLPGMGQPGPRVLDFSPLLKLRLLPVNEMVRHILEACERTLEAKVEVEMAMTFPEDPDGRGKLGFLQVRPMMAPEGTVDLGPDDLQSTRALVASTRTMGNGVVEGIRDVVYLRPDTFQAKHTPSIVRELQGINRELMRKGRRYLLIGFGRWGSSDPWLGVPVTWGMVSGAGAMVEATLPSMNIEPSQGSHFFHNLSSLQVSYFTISHAREADRIDWTWLNGREAETETEFVRHVEVEDGLRVRVDGRTGRGVVERL